MDKYYAVNGDRLRTDLQERRSASRDIKKRTDVWAEEEYGIPGFSGLVEEHLGSSSGIEAIVARHVPSIKIEDIMYYLGSRALGYEPKSISFSRDKFCSNNWSKLACVKIPWLIKERKKLFIDHETIISSHPGTIEGKILADILTKEGIPLVQHHQELRDKLFGKYPVGDISVFFDRCIRLSIESGKYNAPVFVKVDGKEKKMDISQINLAKLAEMDIRPAAGWYYPLYLSFFLDGQRVLLETFDNAPEFQPTFHRTMERIIKGTGLKPLIIRPPYSMAINGFKSKFLLEYPKSFLENPKLLVEIEDKLKQDGRNQECQNPEDVLAKVLNEIRERI